jgi:hypothetical protein
LQLQSVTSTSHISVFGWIATLLFTAGTTLIVIFVVIAIARAFAVRFPAGRPLGHAAAHPQGVAGRWSLFAFMTQQIHTIEYMRSKKTRIMTNRPNSVKVKEVRTKKE